MWANQLGSDDAMQGASWGPAQLPRLLCVQTHADTCVEVAEAGFILCIVSQTTPCSLYVSRC